jgi:hypothetical protein
MEWGHRNIAGVALAETLKVNSRSVKFASRVTWVFLEHLKRHVLEGFAAKRGERNRSEVQKAYQKSYSSDYIIYQHKCRYNVRKCLLKNNGRIPC